MKQEYDIQSAYKYANVKEGSENSQVVQHVGHVPPVIEGVAVGLLSLLHLALVLQHVPRVPPGCHGTQQVALTGGGDEDTSGDCSLTTPKSEPLCLSASIAHCSGETRPRQMLFLQTPGHLAAEAAADRTSDGRMSSHTRGLFIHRINTDTEYIYTQRCRRKS